MPNQNTMNALVTSTGFGNAERRDRANSDGFYDMSMDEHLHESKV